MADAVGTVGREAPSYEVHAIRFAHREATRQDHFLERVADPQASMPISYYLWVAVSASHTVVIDAGYTEETSRRRADDGRQYLASPVETLRRLGVEPADVGTLTLSHLHYDHTGHLAAFPGAEIVLQERELAFWCSRNARHEYFAQRCDPADVAAVVKRNLAGGVRLVDGDAEVAPGVTVHRVGRHTPGTQVVRVPTRRGAVVLTADASHFYTNIEQRLRFALVHTVPLMFDAFDRAEELASSPDLVVPGHDPLVLERFPPSTDALEGLAVRIA